MFNYLVNVGGGGGVTQMMQPVGSRIYLTLLPRHVHATSLSKLGSWHCDCFKETLQTLEWSRSVRKRHSGGIL